MNCDLENYFGDLASKIPTDEASEFIFSAEALPAPATRLLTDMLIVKKGKHFYESYVNSQADILHFQTHKHTYRQLGILILAKVFHYDLSEIHLQLGHPASDIKELVLDYEPEEQSLVFAPGYQIRPHLYTYWPQSIKEFPLADSSIPQRALPLFNLTNASNDVGGDETEWNERDIVRCAGTDQGNILFASILLNLGRPQETCNEVSLEGDIGYGGVGLGSAEVKLCLPNSLGWSGEL
jgi:hypothetical protein